VTTTAPPTDPASAPARQRRLVEQPPIPTTVIGRFPTAVYLHIPAGFGVLAVLTADAVALPCGLRLPFSSTEFPLDRLTGAVHVGDGAVRLGTARIVAGRTVPVRVADLPAPPAGHVRAADHLLGGGHPVPGDLRDPAVATTLLGQGPGLTPSGDDVLAGYLAAAAAYRLPVDGLRALVRAEAAQRTTTLSAALLRHAGEGEAVPEVIALLDALRDGRSLDAALRALVAIGHTSGAALAAGVLAAARTACAEASPGPAAGR
jgi:hypothetical protein